MPWWWQSQACLLRDLNSGQIPLWWWRQLPAHRAIPKLPNGVEILEKKGKAIKWRDVAPKYKHEQELSDKGIKIEKDIIEYYNVSENTDYGMPEREIFDEVDKIHKWLEGIKSAINEANKTELVDL